MSTMAVKQRKRLLSASPPPIPTFLHPKVYHHPMTRTNIEIDDQLVGRAMRLYRLRSKKEAVDLALRKLVGEPMGREEILATEGTGWGGDLAMLRSREEVPDL
jgi:Arc/MetJ family transcription regulator